MLGGEEERSKAADVGVTGEAKGAGMGEGALPSRSEGGLTAVGPQVTDSEAGGVVEEVPFGRGLSWWEERQAQEGHKDSEAQMMAVAKLSTANAKLEAAVDAKTVEVDDLTARCTNLRTMNEEMMDMLEKGAK